MTIEEMESLERESISVQEAAAVIGCSPQRLRDGLELDDRKPQEMRTFLFPHCKVGNRHNIMRRGFLRWVKGEMICANAERM